MTVERFVEAVIGGGLGLVAGLWLIQLHDFGSLPWSLGVGLALVGVGGLAGGIWVAIDF